MKRKTKLYRLSIFFIAILMLLFSTCKDDEEVQQKKETCEDGIKNQDEENVDCGGVCDPCPSCTDGVKNQNETFVDCGGVCKPCLSCADGVKNQDEVRVDCGGVCEACPTCADGIKNQDEVDVDCGGSACNPCSKNPSCSDGVKNQDETGIDCGGKKCKPCDKKATCNDGKKNQGEKDVDCGGPCPACPSCDDKIKNQGEEGIDCGGPCPPCGGNAERQKAVNEYRTHYLGSEVRDAGWTGNFTGCKPGNVSETTYRKVLQRINYFRRMVGLNNASWYRNQFSKYQDAALMMYADRKLSHFPRRRDFPKCYTNSGRIGATGNLCGSKPAKDIRGFMEDRDFPRLNIDNKTVGHRIWIIKSNLTKFGYGACKRYTVLGGNFSQPNNTNIPNYVPYPPNGYIPQKLVFGRWSCGFPGKANVSLFEVKMKDFNGRNINLNVIHKGNVRSGTDATLVWEPQGIDILT